MSESLGTHDPRVLCFHVLWSRRTGTGVTRTRSRDEESLLLPGTRDSKEVGTGSY